MPHFNAVGYIDEKDFPTQEDVMREYRRRYALAAYHERRNELIRKISPTGVCAACAKENPDAPALEPSNLVLSWKNKKAEAVGKEAGVRRANSLITIRKELLDEVLKHKLVEVLCDDHAKRKLWGKGTLTHGTYWAAYRHKCDCEECLEYRADYILRRREDRRFKKNAAQEAREP